MDQYPGLDRFKYFIPTRARLEEIQAALTAYYEVSPNYPELVNELRTPQIAGIHPLVEDLQAHLRSENDNEETKVMEGRVLTRFMQRVNEDPNQLLVEGPPRNLEVEIIGIQYRPPGNRDKQSIVE